MKCSTNAVTNEVSDSIHVEGEQKSKTKRRDIFRTRRKGESIF